MTNEQMREAREQVATLCAVATRDVWVFRALYAVVLALFVWAIVREDSPRWLVVFQTACLTFLTMRLARIEVGYAALRRDFARLNELIKRATRDPV